MVVASTRVVMRVVVKGDRERLGRAIAPGLDDREPEGQAGIKGGLHSFDLDNWLVVVTFGTGGCNLIASEVKPQAHGNDVGVT